MSAYFPQEDISEVSENQKDEIEERVERAEAAIGKLISCLKTQGYKAANYLENARKDMLGDVRRWLKLGIICPRTASMIERGTRELA